MNLSISVVVDLYFICGYNVWTVCDKKCMYLSLLMLLSFSIERSVQPQFHAKCFFFSDPLRYRDFIFGH
jgi:hypothetical protein